MHALSVGDDAMVVWVRWDLSTEPFFNSLEWVKAFNGSGSKVRPSAIEHLVILVVEGSRLALCR